MLETGTQTLTEHLAELRIRLIRSLVAIVVAMAICLTFSETIFDIVRAPILPYLKDGFGGLVFTGVMDKFVAHLKLSALAGFTLACPVWLYQVWRFVAPGLYSHERKYGLMFIGSGTLLFAIGVVFVYWVALPMAFQYLLGFGGSIDKPMITIDQYLSFFITMTVAFGLAFELPLILVILGLIGVVDERFLREKRRYSILIIAVVAAIITPPDVLSMVLLMGPLLVLYEISVLLVAMISRRRRERAN